jgi:hypothetical protein
MNAPGIWRVTIVPEPILLAQGALLLALLLAAAWLLWKFTPPTRQEGPPMAQQPQTPPSRSARRAEVDSPAPAMHGDA